MFGCVVPKEEVEEATDATEVSAEETTTAEE
jgi:hypothetical protein